MQPYQIAALEEAFSRNPETGHYNYSIVVWSDIKKSAKSSIAAAVSLYIADNVPWAENYHIANDLKQVDTRVGKYARRAILLSPYLGKRFRSRGYQILHKSNGSIVDSIPVDPEGEAGSNADFIQFSELWGAMDEAKARMFQEMTLSPTKFGESMRWVESYAGYQEESEILWDLWNLGVNEGELVFPDKLFHVNDSDPTVLELYKNEKARMLCLWNTQPRCPWQTKDYYQAEEAILLPNEFRRMHKNEWVANTETFVPIEWWDACFREKMPTYPVNHPMVISLDAATSNDTFGVLMGGRHPDRKNYPEDACVAYSKKWKPPKGRKLDFWGTEEDPGPLMECERLCRENNVIEVAYDPYQLHDPAMQLQRKLGVNFRPFPQGGGRHSRLWSDSDLRSFIRDRRIWHGGEPGLREHLQNSDAQVDKEERKVRIVKRTQKLKIDLAICLSMMAYEVFRLNI